MTSWTTQYENLDRVHQNPSTKREVGGLFSDDQIQKFVDSYFGEKESASFLDDLQDSPAVRNIAKVPLLLTLLCEVYKDERSLPGANRADIYKHLLLEKLLPGVWEKDKDRKLNRLDELSALAFRLFIQNKFRFSRRDLHHATQFAYEKIWGSLPEEEKTQNRISEYTSEPGILTQVGDGSGAPYLFIHLRIQKYLAARWIAIQASEREWETDIETGGGTTSEGKDLPDRVSIRTLLDRKAWSPHWQEAILLLASQVDDPVPMLELLADEERDDLFRHRLALAAHCLGAETSSRPNQIASRVVYETIQTWEKHVRMGKAPLVELHFEVLLRLSRASLSVGGQSITSYLVSRLEDSDARIRGKASEALGRISIEDSEVIEALISLAEDEDESKSVRRAAAEALGRIGADSLEVIETLTDQLESGHGLGPEEAAEALVRIGAENPEVVHVLTEKLTEGDPQAREAASMVLGRVSPDDEAVTEALVNRLGDEDRSVRRRTARALGEIACDDIEVTRALIERLSDRSNSVCRAAAAALGRVATDDPEVVETLTEKIEDEDQKTREAAVLALGQVAPNDSEVVKVLIERLKDENLGVREMAVEVLGQIAPNESEVVDALMTEWRSAADFGRSAAIRLEKTAEALGRIGAEDPEVIEALTNQLWFMFDAFQHARAAAAEALGRIAPDDPEVVEALVSRHSDSDWRVRAATATALAKVAPTHMKAIETIIEQLGDKDWEVREAAAEALGQAAPYDHEVVEEVVEDLAERLEDDFNSVCRTAAEALGQIGTYNLEAVKVLFDRLGEEDGSNQVIALTLSDLPAHFFSPPLEGHLSNLVSGRQPGSDESAAALTEDSTCVIIYWDDLSRLPN